MRRTRARALLEYGSCGSPLSGSFCRLFELRQLLVQAGLERALLRDEVGIGPHLLVPLVAALQDAIGDRRGLVVAQIEPVGNDRLAGPLAGEAELAPGANVLLRTPLPLRTPARAFPAAQALRAENAVQLFHGDSFRRVVFEP